MNSRGTNRSRMFVCVNSLRASLWAAFDSDLFPSLIRRTKTSAHVIIFALVCASLTHAQQLSPSPDARKILLIADNQEHLLTGGPLRSLSSWTDLFVTSVGLRSPLVNVGGRLLMSDLIRAGRQQGAGLVLHIGDAADISCDDELVSVFEALDKESPDKMWFMTPGNHDGFQSGNFARYQSPASFEGRRPKFYSKPPLQGYGNEKHNWYFACQSPKFLGAKKSVGVDMPKGRAIELYFERLKKRQDASPAKLLSTKEQPFKDGDETIKVPCRVESLEINPTQSAVVDHYQAIARLCVRQQVGNKQTTVGGYASFIIQMIDVGETRIVMLDTSDYYDPNQTLYKVLPIAATKAFLTCKQRKLAARFFERDGKPIDRKNVIVVGHHPLTDFLRFDQQKWIAERAGRYISAHVHAATNLREATWGGFKVAELNIGSTLDYPPQSVMAAIDADGVKIQAGGEGTDSAGPIAECILKEDKWKLEEKVYTQYRKGLYVKHLLAALQKASDRHDGRIGGSFVPLEIPTGLKKGDWQRLETLLEKINGLEGRSRTFWMCQAYYATVATRKERGLAERLQTRAEPDELINYGWWQFKSP